MEVKKGYKQTEVGLIPEDWNCIQIVGLFDFKNGLNKAKDYFGYGTPIVNYMDVFQNPGLFLHNLIGRVDVNRNELKAYEVRKGDVFFTRTSETIEEVGIASVMLDNSLDTVFSGFVLRARPKDNTLANKFKQYCFSARYFRQQVTSRASCTTRALTNGRLLSSTFLAVPPLPEQRAIAEALGDVDALIGSLEKLIAKKRALKQAAMQELLTGKKRLPGFTGEWEVKPLSEVCSMRSGEGITSSKINMSSKYPCYGGNGLRGFTSKFTHDGAYALIGRQGALCGNVVFATGKFFASEHAVVVTPSSNNDIKYLTFILGGMHLNQYSESSAQPGLSVQKLLKLSVALSKQKDEQTAIADVLSDMDAEIEALEKRLEKTRVLKQGMMQELLSGRTRLITN